MQKLGTFYFRDRPICQASEDRNGLKHFACFGGHLYSSFPWKQMRRAGLLTAFPCSKKAFANLHDLNGEVILRGHFCVSNYREVLWIGRFPYIGSGTSNSDKQQARRADSRRGNKAALLQASLGRHLRLHTASHAAIPLQEARMCRPRHKRFNSVERQSSVRRKKKPKTPPGPGVGYVTERLNTQFQIFVCKWVCVWANVSICKGMCEGVCEWRWAWVRVCALGVQGSS